MSIKRIQIVRPAVWGFFVSLVAIGFLLGLQTLRVRRITQHPADFEEERRNTARSVIQAAFQNYSRHLFDVVRRIGADSTITKSLSENRPESASLTFRRLDQFHEDDGVSVDITDAQGNVLAWAGRSVEQNYRPRFRMRNSDTLLFVTHADLQIFLTAGTAIGDGAFFALASVPLESDFPIANRFVASENLSADLASDLGARVDLDFDRPFTLSGLYSVLVPGLQGDTLAVASVGIPSPETGAEEYSGQIDTWIALFSSSGILFLAVIAVSVLAGSSSRIIRLPGIIAAIWGVRYAWLLMGIPRRIVGGGFFDPASYATTFGWGITASPGDLFISLLALLASFSALFLETNRLRGPAGKKTSPSAPFFAYSGFLFPAIVFMFMTRGYAASIRSFVFDSVVRLFDPSVVIPGSLAALMHVNILILSVCYVAATIILLSLMQYCGHLLSFTPFRSWLLILATFVIVIPVFLEFDGTSLVPPLFPPLVVVAAAFAEAWMKRKKAQETFSTLTSLFAASLIPAFVVSVPILDMQLHAKERAQLELAANDILKPADDWLSFVLLDGFRSLASYGPEFPEAADSTAAASSHLAFRLWAQTLLGRRGYNSALICYDPHGREVDRFSVGISDFDQHDLLQKVFDGEEQVVQSVERTTPGMRTKSYGMWGSLRDSTNAVRGTVAILVTGGLRSLFRGETMAPLQSENLTDFDVGFRQSAIVEYQDGQLVSTTNPGWYEGMRVPDQVQESFSNPTSRFVWTTDTVDNVEYRSLFAREPSRPGRVVGISVEIPDYRWHIFNLVKVIFVYAALFAAFLLVRIVFRLTRGTPVVFSFRMKLFIGFAAISVVPLIVLGYYDHRVVAERAEENVERDLRSDLDLIHRRLIGSIADDDEFENAMTDQYCESLAAEYGIDFAAFRQYSLLASSRPELYRSAILDSRLPGEAFANAVLLQKDFFVESEQVGTVTYAVGYAPIILNGRLAGVLSIPSIYRRPEIDQELAQRDAFVVAAYAVILVVITVLGGLLAGRFARPLRELTEAARRVGSGNLDINLHSRSSDEVGVLVRSFNEMIRELRRSRNELARAARESAWREMAKQVAHEIKNPLTPMKLSIQHLRQAFKDRNPDREKLLHSVSRTIIEQIDVLSRIATEFSHFARMPERRFERVNVHVLLRECLTLFGELRHVEFRSNFADHLVEIVADRDELRRVFINIIRNGVQAMERGGILRVETSVAGHRCHVRISDTGSGIAPENQGRIFEPNFSTKTDGTGLGLAISYQIVRDLGGDISFETTIGKGTTFDIELPV